MKIARIFNNIYVTYSIKRFIYKTVEYQLNFPTLIPLNEDGPKGVLYYMDYNYKNK